MRNSPPSALRPGSRCGKLTAARAGPAATRDAETNEISLKLPTGETLNVSREDARVLAQRLWDIAPHPGAAPLAVEINGAVSASALRGNSIVVSEREYGALRQVLGDQPTLE
jgi:hypothetical protein